MRGGSIKHIAGSGCVWGLKTSLKMIGFHVGYVQSIGYRLAVKLFFRKVALNRGFVRDFPLALKQRWEVPVARHAASTSM